MRALYRVPEFAKNLIARNKQSWLVLFSSPRSTRYELLLVHISKNQPEHAESCEEGWQVCKEIAADDNASVVLPGIMHENGDFLFLFLFFMGANESRVNRRSSQKSTSEDGKRTR